jgi:menaquinol-cytochrome c reductase iron-sulfur subunit
MTNEKTNRKEQPASSSRRGFLGKLGLGALVLGLAGQGFAYLRSLVPNVLYEPPRRFKVGMPTDFPEGAKFLEDKRLFIFREGKTYYAISAACTHLGCTVKIVGLNQPKRVLLGGTNVNVKWEFHCPCHGSKFYGEGTNFAGPAPKPLAWYKLEVSPDDGQLVVNMSEEVEQNFRLTV